MPVTKVQSKWNSGALVFHDADDYGVGAEILRIAQDDIAIGTSTNNVTMTIYGDVSLTGDFTVDTEDIKLGDNDSLEFGDADGGDVNILWDTDSLNIIPATDDIGRIEVGNGTKDMDVAIFLGTAGKYALFDVGNSLLRLYDVGFQSGGNVVVDAGASFTCDNVTARISQGITGLTTTDHPTFDYITLSTSQGVTGLTTTDHPTFNYITLSTSQGVTGLTTTDSPTFAAATIGYIVMNGTADRPLDMQGVTVNSGGTDIALSGNATISNVTAADTLTLTEMNIALVGAVTASSTVGITGTTTCAAINASGTVTSSNTTAGFIASGAATDGISITGACTDGIHISGACTATGINIAGGTAAGRAILVGTSTTGTQVNGTPDYAVEIYADVPTGAQSLANVGAFNCRTTIKAASDITSSSFTVASYDRLEIEGGSTDLGFGWYNAVLGYIKNPSGSVDATEAAVGAVMGLVNVGADWNQQSEAICAAVIAGTYSPDTADIRKYYGLYVWKGGSLTFTHGVYAEASSCTTMLGTGGCTNLLSLPAAGTAPVSSGADAAADVEGSIKILVNGVAKYLQYWPNPTT